MLVSTPATAADEAQQHRLDEELQHDMRSRRAPIAMRRPISRVRSVTEDQQDIHDADAADQQRDRGDRSQQDFQNAGCSVSSATSAISVRLRTVKSSSAWRASALMRWRRSSVLVT